MGHNTVSKADMSKMVSGWGWCFADRSNMKSRSLLGMLRGSSVSILLKPIQKSNRIVHYDRWWGWHEGQVFKFDRTPENDSFYHLGMGTLVGGGDFPCGEAWDAISRCVYTALQGDSIMKSWTIDDRMMIACCNDGTRSVIFKIERIDTPESDEEVAWLARQEFFNNKEDAYTG